jgi:hypothetical protein
MRVLTKKGQSMAEYAILFAIVIGAAIAMQQYIKSRLQGTMQGASDNYINAVSATAGFAAVPFEPNRTINTTSGQTDSVAMSSATVGTRTLSSTSDSTSTVTK